LASTGFQKPDIRPLNLDDEARAVADACMADYEHLAQHRIVAP
jgi:hypothetical protein